MIPWLALIESNTSGTGRLFARAALLQGCRPILLSDDPSRYKYVQEDGLDVLQVDTSDPDAVLESCRQLARNSALVGVTSSSEYYIATAAKIASQLKLVGPNHAAIRSCRNKWKQRVRLDAAGIGVPRFRCATSINAAAAAAEELGLSVVVKPVNGTGSLGVRLCQTRKDVAAHARTLLRQRYNERGQPIPRKILVEQLAVGPEYSVETFDRQIVGITRKCLGPLPYFVEIGHDYPAIFSNRAKEEISLTVQRALDALQLGWGPAHFELRLTSEGPKIIEVNPRLAGGYIPELVRLAFGIDLVSATILKAIGEQPSLEKKIDRYASLRFIIPPADGTLAKIDGIERANKVSGIVEVRLYCKPGDQVRRHGDFRDRIGHTIAAAETSAAACAAAEIAHNRINLTVNPA